MVRNAVLEDVPAMVALGARMHGESIYAPFDYCVDKTTKLFETLIACPSVGIALVYEVKGIVVGGFIGTVSEHYFGCDLQASDLALFIEPEQRKGSAAVRLLKAYIEEAKLRGAAQIMLGNSTGVEFERVSALFESVGFVKRGYVFELANGV
jgi:GNAT superfamily N-acetyltransferase